MGIKGIENMTLSQLSTELNNGGKFVHYEYCISLLIITFKRPSDIYFIRQGESAFMKGVPYTGISLLLGWWGIPWGPIYTFSSTFTNISGGKDVTRQVVASITSAATRGQNGPQSVVDWTKA